MRDILPFPAASVDPGQFQFCAVGMYLHYKLNFFCAHDRTVPIENVTLASGGLAGSLLIWGLVDLPRSLPAQLRESPYNPMKSRLAAEL